MELSSSLILLIQLSLFMNIKDLYNNNNYKDNSTIFSFISAACIFRYNREVVPRQSDLLHVLKVRREDNGCVVFNNSKLFSCS